MKRLPPSLLSISPGDLEEGREVGHFIDKCEAAVAGGLRGVLLREFLLPDTALLELARDLRTRLDALDDEAGWLGVHDRVHVALAAKADGVHLGFRSLPTRRVTPLINDAMVIGLSTHADDAVGTWGQADYLFHGPVNQTDSKAGILQPIGLAGLSTARTKSEQPIWALGGLRCEDVEPVLECGIDGIAVLSGIFGDPDPSSAAKNYLARWSNRESV